MLTLNTGPAPIVPLDFSAAIEETAAITGGQTAALALLDADLPNIRATVAEMAEAREAYLTALQFERERAENLERLRVEREALRLAVAEQDAEAIRTGTPPDGEVLRRLQAFEGFLPVEERARREGLNQFREVARRFVAVATRASAERAFLLRLRIESAKLQAEAVLRQVAEIDGRIDPARNSINFPQVEAMLRAEGLL